VIAELPEPCERTLDAIRKNAITNKLGETKKDPEHTRNPGSPMLAKTGYS
jgi:hypothetical protein